MTPRSLYFPAIAVILIGLAHPSCTQAASTVARGWDLLETDPGSTTFFGEPFEGVPLGSFDFGATIGVQDVGPIDTMIHRVSAATVPGPGTQSRWRLWSMPFNYGAWNR